MSDRPIRAVVLREEGNVEVLRLETGSEAELEQRAGIRLGYRSDLKLKGSDVELWAWAVHHNAEAGHRFNHLAYAATGWHMVGPMVIVGAEWTDVCHEVIEQLAIAGPSRAATELPPPMSR